MIRVSRFAAALLAAAPLAAPALLAPAVAQAAVRDAQAEQFISTQATRALGILNNRQLSREQKKRQFRAFVDQVGDVPRITNFVLGKYARTITPQQKQQFGAVFREYASNVYEGRLGDYGGEQLRVTGSLVRKPGDVIVNTVVSGGRLSQPRPVSWRINRGSDGYWRVTDVQVGGIWLAITQQQDFVSTIDNAGGNVNVLIQQLRQQVAQQEASGRG